MPALPWYVEYVPEEPFKKKLERLQKKEIIEPLGVDEAAEWCNSFMLVPKPKGPV